MMFKRRKDGGFTLIELMIVIAIIGILAVVLVPQLSGTKDSAKSAGVLTNAKSIEAYVVSNIEKWQATSLSPATIRGNIDTYTTTNGIKNPYTTAGGTGAILTGATAPTGTQGLVTVTVPDTNTFTTGITVKGYGDSGTDVIYNGNAIKY